MSKQILAEIISNVIGIAVQKVLSMLSSGKVSQSSPHPDSKWLTVLDGGWLTHDGYVLSAYYHPSKQHTATTVGALGTKKSTAYGGKWAVSIQTRGAYGNKAFYNTLD